MTPPLSRGNGVELCEWCREAPARPGGRFCSKRCRQTAYRVRKRAGLVGVADGHRVVAQDLVDTRPMRFAYADPPYPGRARKWYGREDTYGGEVDHAKLIYGLEERRHADRGRAWPRDRSPLDGWALSTSVDALQALLPLCPASTRVCAWVKPIGASTRTRGLHNTWEPLLVVGGRQRPPGRRDWLLAQPARHHGELAGRKPVAFCAWLFDCLGMIAGDELEDLFPGTGIVSRCWGEVSSTTTATSEAA